MSSAREDDRRLRLSLAVGLVLLAGYHCMAAAAEEAVIIETGRPDDVVEIRASAELSVDRDTAWRVLTDYARYPEFLPDLSESRVVSRTGSTVLVEQAGSARVGPLRFPGSVTYRIRESPPDSLESHAIAGSFPLLDSRYTLTSRPGGSELSYTGRVRPPFPLFGSLGRHAVEASVTRQFHALVEEIERRHGEARVPSQETAR